MDANSQQAEAVPTVASVPGYAAEARKRSRYHFRRCASNPLVWLVRDSADGTLWRFASHHGGEATASAVCELLNKQHNDRRTDKRRPQDRN